MLNICLVMAFNNANLGYVHAMAHQLGGYYNLPHGVCNAILLPHVQEYNSTICQNKLSKIFKIMNGNLEGISEKESAKLCINKIRELSETVGIPRGLKELGVKESDFKILSKNTLNDACAITNPRKGTLDDIIELFRKAM